MEWIESFNRETHDYHQYFEELQTWVKSPVDNSPPAEVDENISQSLLFILSGTDGNMKVIFRYDLSNPLLYSITVSMCETTDASIDLNRYERNYFVLVK